MFTFSFAANPRTSPDGMIVNNPNAADDLSNDRRDVVMMPPEKVPSANGYREMEALLRACAAPVRTR